MPLVFVGEYLRLLHASLDDPEHDENDAQMHYSERRQLLSGNGNLHKDGHFQVDGGVDRINRLRDVAGVYRRNLKRLSTVTN